MDTLFNILYFSSSEAPLGPQYKYPAIGTLPNEAVRLAAPTIKASKRMITNLHAYCSRNNLHVNYICRENIYLQQH